MRNLCATVLSQALQKVVTHIYLFIGSNTKEKREERERERSVCMCVSDSACIFVFVNMKFNLFFAVVFEFLLSVPSELLSNENVFSHNQNTYERVVNVQRQSEENTEMKVIYVVVLHSRDHDRIGSYIMTLISSSPLRILSRRTDQRFVSVCFVPSHMSFWNDIHIYFHIHFLTLPYTFSECY